MGIGFIGLGNIGQPMAARLVAAGFDLCVHDLDRRKAEPLLAAGARWGATSRETAEGVETLITSLPGPPNVSDDFAGEDGLLSCLGEGQVWVEMSTSDRELTARLADALARKGARSLEAPVTGGVANARSGRITIFVGGDRSTFESREHVFAALAREVIYLGALGNATAAKLITNMVAFVHEAALAEGLLLGRRAGVPVGPLLEAIQHSYAGSFVADVDGPRVLAGSYDSAFAVKLALKDMALTHALGESLSVPLAFGSLATEALAKSRERYGPDSDTLLMIKRLEEELGVSLREQP